MDKEIEEFISRGQQKQTRWSTFRNKSTEIPTEANRNVRQQCFHFIQDAGQIAQRRIGTLFIDLKLSIIWTRLFRDYLH